MSVHSHRYVADNSLSASRKQEPCMKACITTVVSTLVPITTLARDRQQLMQQNNNQEKSKAKLGTLQEHEA